MEINSTNHALLSKLRNSQLNDYGWKDAKLHPLFNLRSVGSLTPVFDNTKDLASRSCIGQLSSPIAKDIPIGRIRYWCGQRCTWPDEATAQALREEEAEARRVAKGTAPTKKGRGRPQVCLIFYTLWLGVRLSMLFNLGKQNWW